MIYINNLIVYSQILITCAGFEEGVRKGEASRMQIIVTKSILLRDQLPYISDVFTSDRDQPDKRNTENIRLTPPRNLKELHGFLELTGYYHKFVEEYAALAEPYK